jgi:hypothetical protein
MTHRDQQNMRRRTQSTHIAESALLAHRMPQSPAARRSTILVCHPAAHHGLRFLASAMPPDPEVKEAGRAH